ncbi:MAG TPA: biotin-dependent carboxyltransferase family protein [Methylomirabilota bacterium]|nr:biotin-dependent carboxyltransferase family protein [Methylomirabilota bacterium]
MIRILDAGPQTTVQDLGRTGRMRYGIPPSGPVDRFAFVLANRLLGNPDTAAALECTLMGPRFEMTAAGAIAVTGADMPVTVNGQDAPGWATIAVKSGDVVKLGAARTGVRSYVGFAGGLDVPLVLGSRATYLRGRIGGLQGRALRKGDELAILPSGSVNPRRVARRDIPDYTGEPTVRAVLGPQADRFTDEGLRALFGGLYEVLPQSDRMGSRLRGPRIEHARGHDIISDGIALGSIQVPGDGQPIVLLVDRQSTGGYTKAATICSSDIWRVGQARPGQWLRFQWIEVEEAHRLLRESDTALEAAVREESA